MRSTEHEIFTGDLPLMTSTFVINGAERVIVSQLVRSPGISTYGDCHDKIGKELYSSTVIPNAEMWLDTTESPMTFSMYV